jgi:hypothetical protein
MCVKIGLVLFPILVVSLGLAGSGPGPKADGDHDGLPDAFEQDLLKRFAPSFMIPAGDCAGSPAEFVAGSPEPRVLAANGTVYGQVFPSQMPAERGTFIEVHFYHLWARDCGRNGHPLDVEHVSGLLHASDANDPPERWMALFWYASAHQDTLCDTASGARAATLNATVKGPTVWISRGKHASFLNSELCTRGCGADTCDGVAPLTADRIVNLGEPGKPLNGAVWVSSKRWTLAEKMQPDFNPPALAMMNHSEVEGAILLSTPGKRRTQAVVAAGDTAVDAVAAGKREAESQTGQSLKKAEGSVKRSLRRTFRAVKGALTAKPSTP